jgi:hypothetical protein
MAHVIYGVPEAMCKGALYCMVSLALGVGCDDSCTKS